MKPGKTLEGWTTQCRSSTDQSSLFCNKINIYSRQQNTDMFKKYILLWKFLTWSQESEFWVIGNCEKFTQQTTKTELNMATLAWSPFNRSTVQGCCWIIKDNMSTDFSICSNFIKELADLLMKSCFMSKQWVVNPLRGTLFCIMSPTIPGTWLEVWKTRQTSGA